MQTTLTHLPRQIIRSNLHKYKHLRIEKFNNMFFIAILRIIKVTIIHM